MKILQLINGLGAGGAEKLIVETVPELVKLGNHVDVLLLNSNKTPFYEKLQATNSCRIFALGKSFYNPFYIFKIIPFLKNYDVVHVHLFPALYFAVFAKVFSLSKVKFVFTEHNTNNRRLENSKYQFIERWIYKNYDQIISITNQVKEVLKEKLMIEDKKIITIENGINLSDIYEAPLRNRVSLGFSNEDKLIVMVAAFREQKDQDTVIKSIKKLPEKYKLILVGDGVRRTQLESLVDTLNLKNRVFFMGFRSDVYSIIKMCDIAVLSSHWEGFGLAAAESMACGIPTIASNVPGLADVVDSGGLLFEKGNVEDLKEKILSLENADRNKNLVLAGSERAQKYDIKNMVNSLNEIYLKLVNG